MRTLAPAAKSTAPTCEPIRLRAASASHCPAPGWAACTGQLQHESIATVYAMGGPRLPLPIEEEVHTPGSPIISPTDLPVESLDHGEVEGSLPRRTSMLSSTTADDDDLGEEFKVPTPGRPTVPTLIEWEGPGERVYVTGTFAGWNRKYRLHQR